MVGMRYNEDCEDCREAKGQRLGWALKINGRIRAVSLVRLPDWSTAPTAANRRRTIVRVKISEVT